MKVFRLDDLDAERAANQGAYLRFLKERNMSAGLYALNACESDPQQPHDRDVALAGFDLGHITLGKAGAARELPARHAVQRAHLANPAAQLAEKLALLRQTAVIVMRHRPDGTARV